MCEIGGPGWPTRTSKTPEGLSFRGGGRARWIVARGS